jgi:hypothetical protein
MHKNLIDMYEDLMQQNQQLQAKIEELKTTIMEQIQDQLDAVDAEFAPTLKKIQDNMKELEMQARAEVQVSRVAITGTFYECAPRKGTITWDDDGLLHFCAMHSEYSKEIMALRDSGTPTTRFGQKAKGKK